MRRSLLALVLAVAASAPASASALKAPGRVAFNASLRVPVDSPYAEGAVAGAALPDGGAVLVGGGGEDVEVARLDADGHLVPSFGSGGIARPRVPGGFEVAQVLLRPDGGVLLVGAAGANAVLALTAGGARDAGYGVDGLARSPVAGGRGAALLPDGEMIVAGSGEARGPLPDGSGSGRRWLLTRLDPDGAVDRAFGAGGIAEVPLDAGETGDALSVGLGSGGRILALARVNGGSQLRALTPEGTVDAAYNGGAPVHIADGSASAALYRADGTVDVISVYLIRRFGPDGRPDLSYGRNGRADLAGIYTSDSAPRAFAEPDGGVVLAQPTAQSVRPVAVGDVYLFRVAPNGVRGPVLPFRLGFGGGDAGGLISVSAFTPASLLPRVGGGVLVAGGTRIAAFTGTEGSLGGFSAGFYAAAAFTSSLEPDRSYGGPSRGPQVALHVPEQRVRVVRALRRIVVQARVDAPGLLLVRVRDGHRHVVAQSVVPVYRAGSLTARIAVTRRGRKLLGARLRSGLSVSVGYAFRDVLTQSARGVERVRLR